MTPDRHLVNLAALISEQHEQIAELTDKLRTRTETVDGLLRERDEYARENKRMRKAIDIALRASTSDIGLRRYFRHIFRQEMANAKP